MSDLHPPAANDDHDPFATVTGAYLNLLRLRARYRAADPGRMTADQRRFWADALEWVEGMLANLRPYL